MVLFTVNPQSITRVKTRGGRLTFGVMCPGWWTCLGGQAKQLQGFPYAFTLLAEFDYTYPKAASHVTGCGLVSRTRVLEGTEQAQWQ